MIFIHRFGAPLNTPLHFHCIVVEGVFAADAGGGAVFQLASGLDASAIGEVQTAVRRRLLRSALRRGLLSADDAQEMAEWEHGGGFSVTALAQPTEIVAAPTPVDPIPPEAAPAEPLHRQAARDVWAWLLARIHEVLPLLGPTSAVVKCGSSPSSPRER